MNKVERGRLYQKCMRNIRKPGSWGFSAMSKWRGQTRQTYMLCLDKFHAQPSPLPCSTSLNPHTGTLHEVHVYYRTILYRVLYTSCRVDKSSNWCCMLTQVLSRYSLFIRQRMLPRYIRMHRKYSSKIVVKIQNLDRQNSLLHMIPSRFFGMLRFVSCSYCFTGRTMYLVP